MAVFLLLLLASIFKDKLNFTNSSPSFQWKLELNTMSRGSPWAWCPLSSASCLPGHLPQPLRALAPSSTRDPGAPPSPHATKRPSFTLGFLKPLLPYSHVHVSLHFCFFTLYPPVAFLSFKEKLKLNQTSTSSVVTPAFRRGAEQCVPGCPHPATEWWPMEPVGKVRAPQEGSAPLRPGCLPGHSRTHGWPPGAGSVDGCLPRTPAAPSRPEGRVPFPQVPVVLPFLWCLHRWIPWPCSLQTRMLQAPVSDSMASFWAIRISLSNSQTIAVNIL